MVSSEAPAPRARRLRRKTFLFGFFMMLSVLIITISSGRFGLLDNKVFQGVYAAACLLLFAGYGIWIAMRKSTVLCPRC
jgi:hypothetical protein